MHFSFRQLLSYQLLFDFKSNSRSSNCGVFLHVNRSVDCLSETGLWLHGVLSFIEGHHPLLFILAKLGPSWVLGARDHSLILWLSNCILEFFPWCMISITETACAFNRPSLETFGASGHAKRFFEFRFKFGRAHNPVLIFLLLFSKNFTVPNRHAVFFRCWSELFDIFIGECKRFLSICKKGGKLS